VTLSSSAAAASASASFISHAAAASATSAASAGVFASANAVAVAAMASLIGTEGGEIKEKERHKLLTTSNHELQAIYDAIEPLLEANEVIMLHYCATTVSLLCHYCAI
jgi:hypothetical protein